MFSSRNIHFAILGIILGAASGYVFAFYQVQTSMPTPAAAAGSRNSSQNHPPVNNDQILALFKAALEKKPNEPELMTRYASFLANLGRYSEAVEWFQKVLTVHPDNLDARTDLATALWNMGQTDKAMAEYQKSLTIDPKHMPTLHSLFLMEVDSKHDLQAATNILKKMEQIDPKYPPLPELKELLANKK